MLALRNGREDILSQVFPKFNILENIPEKNLNDLSPPNLENKIIQFRLAFHRICQTLQMAFPNVEIIIVGSILRQLWRNLKFEFV